MKSKDKSQAEEAVSAVGDTTSRGRRRLLKALLGAGAVTTGATMLPREWATPVVDTVILPVHAGASDDDDDDVPAPGS